MNIWDYRGCGAKYLIEVFARFVSKFSGGGVEYCEAIDYRLVQNFQPIPVAAES